MNWGTLLGFAVVAGRLVLLARLATWGHPLSFVLAASEAFALLMSFLAYSSGWTDSTVLGALVPACYMVPLLLVPVGAGPSWGGALFITLCLVQFAMRLWFGVRLTVGPPSFVNLRSSGPWSVVRHPLAVCEICLVLAFVVRFPSGWNGLVACGAVAAFVMACLVEERHLRTFASYRKYTALVRYRFIPGLA